MDISESFLGRPGGNGKEKKELPQKEREAKQDRWSELHYKLGDEMINLSSEERKKLEEEKAQLLKEIT
jgi:hypothetical protein